MPITLVPSRFISYFGSPSQSRSFRREHTSCFFSDVKENSSYQPRAPSDRRRFTKGWQDPKSIKTGTSFLTMMLSSLISLCAKSSECRWSTADSSMAWNLALSSC